MRYFSKILHNKTIARDNNLEILRLCKKHEVPTILGSDAHISFQIADYERLYPLLAETDFPDELIMNYWPDRFFEYLGIEKWVGFFLVLYMIVTGKTTQAICNIKKSQV